MQQQRDEGRLGTGVPGLDMILHGGLIPGSVFIVQGAPGAGKTILANQICFHHARTGSKALYVTLLAESHDRLLTHLGRLAFFDPRQVPESIYFISGFDTLAREGLKGILQLLRSESRERQSSLIVLDGLFALEETAQSAKEFRKFINDLTTLAGLIGCTMLLLTNTGRRRTESVEYTMVDGWIELELRQMAQRAERSVRVLKYRGSSFVQGRHTICIDAGGIHVFPRLEALAQDRVRLPLSGKRLGTGITELDRVLNGGLPSATATLLVGPTGIGKTLTGLHFMAGSSADEPGLIFNFYETEEQIRVKDAALELGLTELIGAGHVLIVRAAPTEQRLDVLAHRLLELVREHGVKRLLVDGIDGFSQSVADVERLPQFMTALSTALCREGTTTVYTLEQPHLVQAGGSVTCTLSSVVQNIVMMDYVEIDSELRRAIMVLKVRDSSFDRRIRELDITPQGVRIGEVLPPGTFTRGVPAMQKT